MALVLGDEEFFEGLLGGLGWILSVRYFRHAHSGNPVIAGFVGWMSLWFIRKMGMRIYRDWRKDKLDKTSGVRISGVSPMTVFILFCISIIVLSWSKITIDTIPLYLSNMDLMLVSTLAFLVYHIYH
jgi:hypothetical protein